MLHGLRASLKALLIKSKAYAQVLEDFDGNFEKILKRLALSSFHLKLYLPESLPSDVARWPNGVRDLALVHEAAGEASLPPQIFAFLRPNALSLTLVSLVLACKLRRLCRWRKCTASASLGCSASGWTRTATWTLTGHCRV